MKFACSAGMIVWLSCAHARDIVLIQHWDEQERVVLVQEILLKQMNIPPDFITIRQRRTPCQANTSSVLHICFDEKHEMQFPHIDQQVLERTLKIFGEIKNEI